MAGLAGRQQLFYFRASRTPLPEERCGAPTINSGHHSLHLLVNPSQFRLCPPHAAVQGVHELEFGCCSPGGIEVTHHRSNPQQEDMASRRHGLHALQGRVRHAVCSEKPADLIHLLSLHAVLVKLAQGAEETLGRQQRLSLGPAALGASTAIQHSAAQWPQRADARRHGRHGRGRRRRRGRKCREVLGAEALQGLRGCVQGRQGSLQELIGLDCCAFGQCRVPRDLVGLHLRLQLLGLQC
mmetsp:Transcript_69412/g.192048  ORF Transcript_69412/g.192048 Transcript_69412/m.192048 type:complete len:240 (-) Transcript_69412:337-1056(-)